MNRNALARMLMVILLAVAVSASPVSGKMYRWVDENGVTHFSDVPPENREIQNVYETGKGMQPSAAGDKKGQALIAAAGSGDVEKVKKLIEDGADVNAEKENGWTALITAASRGHVRIVELLIEHGADIQTQADSGVTALWMSSKNGKVGVVRLLLDLGAGLEAENRYGETAVMHALWSKKFEAARLLLEAGADVHKKSMHGSTACNIARIHGSEEIKQYLKKKGCR